MVKRSATYRRDEPQRVFQVIGDGGIGGKAHGLARMHEILQKTFPKGFEGIRVDIPQMTVLGSGVFERFMERNKLWEKALEASDDTIVALLFQKASLPEEVVGDLLSLISRMHTPLAVRSSALLEDSLNEPFAGVYESKMIPNRSFDSQMRFRQLAEAIKFVYASMFQRKARSYFKVIGRDVRSERMAVIIQEMVGERYEDYYYPSIAGVIRSLNFYPTGNALPENGVVQLALGFGKTIVDGGKAWCYSPKYPAAPPPYNTLRELLLNTQTKYWAVNMGAVTEYDPTRETEYLTQHDIDEAEPMGGLDEIASTYDVESDRIVTGIYGRGPRLLNFAPILHGAGLPLNALISRLLLLAEERLGARVEIEFALNYNPAREVPPRLGFLQVRPLAISAETVDLGKVPGSRTVVLPDHTMGNGAASGIEDIVFLKREAFQASETRQIAGEMDSINDALVDSGRKYLLIGFGRWGSSDPWLGVPVSWSQISGARAIVEATLPEMSPDFSQGAHFFHNMFSHGVFYLSVQSEGAKKIDWEWIEAQRTIMETRHVRHVRVREPLSIRVDGRIAQGVVHR
jgi:hypothetical protein